MPRPTLRTTDERDVQGSAVKPRDYDICTDDTAIQSRVSPRYSLSFYDVINYDYDPGDSADIPASNPARSCLIRGYAEYPITITVAIQARTSRMASASNHWFKITQLTTSRSFHIGQVLVALPAAHAPDGVGLGGSSNHRHHAPYRN